MANGTPRAPLLLQSMAHLEHHHCHSHWHTWSAITAVIGAPHHHCRSQWHTWSAITTIVNGTPRALLLPQPMAHLECFNYYSPKNILLVPQPILKYLAWDFL